MSPQRRDELRAADVDRTFVANLLKQAVDEGRLSLHEYDDRLQRTYAARTYGELDQVVGDLPRPPRGSQLARPGFVPQPDGPAEPSAGGRPGWVTGAWYAWFLAVGINTVIWFIVMVSTGHWVYPWPLWVAGPWGVVLLAGTLFNRERRRD